MCYRKLQVYILKCIREGKFLGDVPERKVC